MALQTLSTEELQAELKRRQKDVTKLQARRDKFAQQIAEIDAELRALGHEPRRMLTQPLASSGRRRARNGISLPDAIAKSMESGATASPSEMAKMVRDNGYKTHARNFNMMVSNAMAKDKRFKRVGRRQYERMA